MILTELVLVDVGGRNQSHYEGLGYTLPKEKDSRGRIRVPKGTKMEVRVLDVHPTSNVRISYSCDECGKIKEVAIGTIIGRKNSQYLKDGKIHCSQCANKLMSGENNSNYKHGNNRYCEYRYNAGRRGYKFLLSVEEFETLVSQPCHYCGGYSSDFVENSRGNGIDRVDSSSGYSAENCVPCCSKCNFVKNTMPYREFLDYIGRIYKRRVENEI